MKKHVKLFEDFLPGGLADNKPDSDFDSTELSTGQKEEGEEHTDDPWIAKEIAKDHLVQDPNYYANEDVADPLVGGEAEKMKLALDTKTAAHISEDTTNPDGPQQKDGQELRSNNDLSNFAIPEGLTDDEMKAYIHNRDTDNEDDRSIARYEKIEYILGSLGRKSPPRTELNMMSDEGLDKLIADIDMFESKNNKLDRKMKKVMGEWKGGTLKTPQGKKVTDQKQAIAIAYSEAGKSKKKKTNESYEGDTYDKIEYIMYAQDHRIPGRRYSREILNQLPEEKLDKIIANIDSERGEIKTKNKATSADLYSDDIDTGNLEDLQGAQDYFPYSESIIKNFESFIAENNSSKVKSLNNKKASEIKKIAKDPKIRNLEQKKVNAIRKSVRKTSVNESRRYSKISPKDALIKAEQFKNGGYDQGQNFSISEESIKFLDGGMHSFTPNFLHHEVPHDLQQIYKWTGLVARNFLRESEKDGQEFSVESAISFIDNHLIPIVMAFIYKYHYINRGIVEAIIFQDFA